MEILEAIILGIIQGLTEFLPVSSSGHLELAKALMGDSAVSEQGMLFTILVHAATALSTVVVFRKDIAEILKGLFQFKWNESTQFSLKIILSMIPAGVIGLVFKGEIDALFGGNIILVGSMLILTGLLLFLADRAKETTKDVSFSRALIIGISQAIAILPGISRSGATISTSVLLGVDRTRAARFSFLMVVPLILGAMLVETKDYIELREFESLSAEVRTELILEEFVSEFDDESKVVYDEILRKENKWDELSKGTYNEEVNNYKEEYFEIVDFAFPRDEDLDRNNFFKSNTLAGFRPTSQPQTSSLIFGFLAAFFTGLLACTWMIALVKKSKLSYFAIYCFLVGVLAIIISFT